MFKKLKLLKDQRGLTLIELLVVVVILGIIAAIAITSIGGIMDNSKEDAHIANAKQMANAARMHVSTEGITINTGDSEPIPLSDLISQHYLDAISDPSNSDALYDATNTIITITNNAGTYEYYIDLVGLNGETYIDTNTVQIANLSRTEVTLP